MNSRAARFCLTPLTVAVVAWLTMPGKLTAQTFGQPPAAIHQMTSSLAQLPKIFTGVGIADQGDEVPRPAGVVEVSLSDTWFVHSQVFGRYFDDFYEHNWLLSAGMERKLFGPLPLVARGGLSLLDEYTRFEGEKNHNLNIGVHVGLAYRYAWEPWNLAVLWDSHIYPAGAVGGIFLATGRKHFLGLAAGYSL